MSEPNKNIIEIQTPEGITFALRLAGPMTRFLAWFIDLAIIAVLMNIVGITVLLLNIISPDVANAFAILMYFILSIGYSIAFEWLWNGQTMGKRILRLRVMDVQGLHLRFNQIVIRNLLRFVDSLPATYLIGGTACFLSGKSQRLGDMAANTIVVWNPKIPEPDLTQSLSDKYNSFRDYPHLIARLRQDISHIEAEIALQAILRRDELSPLGRVELFGDIAAHLKTRTAFPQQAFDGLSDEQYTRNIVDVLYNTNSTH